MKKLPSAVVVFVLIFTLCSCAAKKKTVLTVAGAPIDSEIFSFYLDKVVGRPLDYGLTEAPSKEELKAAAVCECKRYLYKNTSFINAGLSLSASKKVEIAQTVNDLWIRFENHYKKIGVSKRTLTKIRTADAYGDALFSELYDKGRRDAEAERKIKEYFYSNYASFRTVCAYFTSADGSAPMTQLEKNQLLDSFDSLKSVKKTDLATFKKRVEDAGYNLSDSTLLKKGSDGYPVGFFERVYAQDAGTVQIIVYDECVFAAFKEDLKEKGEGVYEIYRSSCVSDLYSAAARERENEYVSSATVEENGGEADKIVRRLTQKR